MANIKYRISLEGGEQVATELLSIEEAIKRLQNAAKTSAGADTFASTTAAISTLGNTAQEAFTKAEAAAKKFGASTAELARVNGIIKALASRSKDSGTAFATLAQNYDKARGSLLGVGGATATAGAGLGRVAAAAVETEVVAKRLNTTLGLTRTQFGMVAQVAAVAGIGPLGRLASAVGGASAAFGGLAGALAGIAVGGGFLAKFAIDAAASAKALGTLSEVSGQSFDSLSGLQQAFGQLGISAETFQQTFTNLFLSLSAQAPQLGLELAGAADKATSATNAFKQAQLGAMRANVTESLAKGYIDAEGAARRLTRIQLASNKLATEAAGIASRNADLAAQSAQQNNLKDVAAAFKTVVESGQQLQVIFPPLTTIETKAKAIQVALLGVQKAGGDVATALQQMLRAVPLADALNIGKALGITPEVIDAIRSGTATLAQLRQAALASGLAISQLNRPELTKLDQSIKKISGSWENFKNQLGVAVAPVFNDLMKQVLGFGIVALETFQAIGVGWDTLKAAFTEPVFPPSVLEGMSTVTTLIREGLASLGKDVKNNMAALNQAGAEGENLGAAVKEGAQVGETATDKLIQRLKALQADLATVEQKAGDAGNAIARGVAPAGDGQRPMGKTITVPSVVRPQISTEPLKAFEAAAEEMLQRLRTMFSSLGDSIVINVDFISITTAAQTAATEISTAFATLDIAGALNTQIDLLIQKFNELAQAATQAAAAAAAMPGGGGGGGDLGQHARGGFIGGRGTGTSDSNLAWLSRGEYVTPARAVRQPGVLAFLEALRRSGGDLSRLLDGMGRFALGGMVARPMAIPAFAAGGLNRGNNVTIQFPGLPPVTGLHASSEVVDQLRKAAAMAQVRSGGRKPSRYS